MTPAARALLASLVDYAGLFPPASLAMADAVAEYRRWRASPEAWMLGCFVVPAARLAELARALGGGSAADGPWPLSVLAGPDAAADLARVLAFEREKGARVRSVELKAAGPAALETALDAIAGRLVYVELPADDDLGPLLARLKARRARAKLRTGGVTAEAIPAPAAVARFLRECARAGVPFKATAGLHHAVRAEHALSYAPAAPRAKMHGFLNLFTAAALARLGPAADLEAVLLEEDPTAFALEADGLAWRGLRASTPALADCRATFAASFGSCSFAEPVAELRALGMIS